jgi:HAD superfamily hydrolase (TIGR01509 family)
MPILGVLFDLGGTLIDTTDPIGWSEAAAALGVRVDPDHLAHSYREVEAERDRPSDGSVRRNLWAEVLERAAGRPVPDETGVAFLERFRASAFAPPLFSDARYCLERFQEEGTALGVVSNSDSAGRVEGHLKRVGIGRFFSTIVSSGTEGVAKPDPRIFRIGVERLGVPAERALYVGDLAYADAKAASSAGLNGVWLNRFGWGFGDDPPEITSLTELPGYARRLGERPR